MKTKRIITLAASLLLLASCSDIIAKPVDLDKTVLVNELSEIVNNTLEKVYMNYHDSSSFKQHVLDEVLLTIAEHEFGPYATLADTDPFKLSVDKRAKELFYNEISTGSYTYRSVFDEKQFVVERIYGAENSYIVDGSGNEVSVGALDTISFFKEGIFLPIVDKDNFDLASFKLVHFDYYDYYIEDKYVDTIYRDKLVEKYVKDEQSSTIGRNYAREVEYVAIKNNANHPGAALLLVNAFANTNILGAGSSDLAILANAWRGVSEDFLGDGSAETLLLAQTNIKTLKDDVEADFLKIDANPDKTDESIESRFTGNGAYTIHEGKVIQTNEVRKQNFVTKTWGIKNGGIGGLPEAIRTRLFNIGVANGVDYVADDAGTLANAGKWEGDTENSRRPSTFVRNIDGEYFLVSPEASMDKTNNRNFIFFENDTYYIVKVKEAVNTAKLTDDEDVSYKNLGRSDAEIDEIVDEVAYHLAQISATKTTALNHYMEELEIVFHDEFVKEFFEAEFPEVFGEDE